MDHPIVIVMTAPSESRSSASFAGATNPEGGVGGGVPPSELVGARVRAVNVQEVRLPRGLRAPPCGWTPLVALAGDYDGGISEVAVERQSGQALERFHVARERLTGLSFD